MSDMNKNRIPDTLLLEERAAIAMNALVGVADEDYEHIPFFNGNFKDEPAYMTHGNWDFGSSHGRLVDAMALVRCMTGTTFGEDIERIYRKNLMSYFRKDGLSYRRNTFTDDVIEEHMAPFRESASMIDQRAALMGVMSWYRATGDEAAKTAADKLCAGLARIARKERNAWYMPASEWMEDGWPSFDAVHTRLSPDPAAMWGRQVGPLTQWHALTGNRDAFDLAENFTSHILTRSGVFLPDGSFNGALEYRNGHFHTRMGTLSSLAAFGAFTHDADILSRIKKSFDWALTQCTGFGWTPGDMHDQAYEHETCTLVDAIATAITLAENGYPEMWSVAERFLRNHLTESQLLDVSWIRDLDTKEKDIPKQVTYYHVAERLRGAFSGYAAPNDFVYDGMWGRGHIMDVQTCCLGSGTRGLFLGWSSAVTERAGRVRVNLLLTRSTPWLDVRAFMPHEGKLELVVHRDLPDLLVRIPEWTPYGGVAVTRTHGGETVHATGRTLPWVEKVFLRLGAARAGETITITFPLVRRVTTEKAVHLAYRTEWLGDDVVGIDPAGTYYPLYNHRKVFDTAPMRDYGLTCSDGAAFR